MIITKKIVVTMDEIQIDSYKRIEHIHLKKFLSEMH